MASPAEAEQRHIPFEQQDAPNRNSLSELACRHGISGSTEEWAALLARDLETRLLDELFPCLFLVAKKAGNHIDQLHQHVLRGRNVVINEDPEFHLVRYYERIYLKPLPGYLLNYAFWEQHIQPGSITTVTNTRTLNKSYGTYEKYRTAMGYLRSYAYLIQHESDFRIAQQTHLIPEYMSFDCFQKFIRQLRAVPDADVSDRYTYGQFRLTRLNWATRIVYLWRLMSRQPSDGYRHRVRMEFEDAKPGQTSQWISRYAAPLVFIFALLSLVLSSMQVVLTALGTETWQAFTSVSWGFSVAIIIFALAVMVVTAVIVLAILCSQLRFALTAKRRESQVVCTCEL